MTNCVNLVFRFCLVLLLGSIKYGLAEESHPIELSEVLYVASYLDGGSFAFSAVTDANKLIYINAGIEEDEAIDIAYYASENILNNAKLRKSIFDGMNRWALTQLQGKPVIDWINDTTSVSSIPKSVRHAILIWGFLEEVCANRKLVTLGSEIILSGFCDDKL